MKIYYDKYHHPERPTVYLGTPNHKIVCALNGIDDDSFSLKANLNNTYELSFDVAKFITINGVEIESNAYSLIDMLMRVYITGIGWFLLEAPKINNDGKKETKSITAQSAEIEMQQHDIRNLKIGQGTTDSNEMLIEDNVHIVDGIERAKENIRFYNPDNPELSLLDILMRVSGLKDWSVGYIDPTPKIYKYYEEGELKEKQVQLSDETGSFDIGTQDLYSFLTQDAAQLYSCVFVFDFDKLTINAYRPENLGKDTNINIGFRNLQQSNDISVDEKNIFTRYQVSGSDDLGIQYVNFGSNIIENLDYYLTEKYLTPAVITKYKLWQDDLEIQRPLYIEQTRLYNEQMHIISELKNRVPLDDCSTDWSTFSDEKLLEAQANYQAQLKGYEDFYVDENGNFDKAALDASSDAKDYYQIKDVILPSIQIEIDNRNLPTKEGEADYIDSYKTDWELYGLDELEVKLSVYNKRKKVLEDSEYGGEYKPDKHTRDIYDKLHQEYVDITNQLDPLFTGSCQEEYNHRKTDVDNAEVLLDQYDAERKSIAESVEKSTWVHDDYRFSKSDLSELSKLYIDNDYTNDYMLLTDSDDAVSAIDEQLKLLSAAQDDLYIASQPQYIYSTNLDNFLAKYEYKNYTDNLNLGDFIYLGVRDNYIVKLRVISISYNPMKMDNNLQIEFSNMIRSRADRNDFSYMLNSTSGRGKSSSSGSSHGFLGNEGVTLTAGLIQKLLQAGAFSNKVGQIINNEFAGYIGSFISVKNLNTEMIKATDVVGENGFFEYLQSKLISADKVIADSGEFRKLKTLVGYINQLLSGTISAELGHIIRLTSETVTIDEAVIRDIIAAQITVSMLKAGTISSDKFFIKSNDGGLSIIGNTMQFKDINDITRIQIGRDTNDNFTFCLYDETGTGILIDSTGIKNSAISDGLIKNDMIANDTISKDKLAFNTVETDENGNIDAAKVIINGQGINAQFTSIKNDLSEAKSEMSEVSTKVDAVEKSIVDEIWKDTIVEVKDENGNVITTKSVESLLVSNTVNLSGIEQKVENVKTYVGEASDDPDGNSNMSLTERVSFNRLTATSIREQVTQAVIDTEGKIADAQQSITEKTAEMIVDMVENQITGEGSYVNQKTSEIEQIIGKKLFDAVKVRYIRDWLYFNDKDNQNRFVECKAIKADNTNIAKGKVPTAYDKNLNVITAVSNLSKYTDDIIDSSYIYNSDVVMLQLDLGLVYNDITTIQIWHYYEDGRTCDSKLEISEDGENWFSLYDSTINGRYAETSSGYENIVQTESISDQISFLKQTLNSFNLTIQENSENYAQILAVRDEIRESVQKVEGNVTSINNQIMDAKGWKLYMNKTLGMNTDIDIDNVNNIETCIQMNPEDGITVTSSSKEGYMTSLMPDELAGYYNDGTMADKGKKVFSVKGDLTMATRFQAKTGIDYVTMKQIPVTYTINGTTRNMLSIIRGGGES